MQLSEMQTLIMWALLGQGGQGLGGKLKPPVKAKNRDALEKAGLIAVAQRRNAFFLEVTDRGWRWALDHLGDKPSARTNAGSVVLQAWLTRLQGYMRAKNVSLAEILVSESKPDPVSGRSDLFERIRQTYLDVTHGQLNKRALLRDIRSCLPDVDRHTLDEALKRMQREGRATLMQLDNRAEITADDRAASLQIGREPRHILWISQ